MALCLEALALTLVLGQGHMAQIDRTGLPATLQHLPEQVRRGSQMVLAEVGSVIGRQHHEGDVFIQPLLHPPRGSHSGAVAQEENLDHHLGVLGRAAPILALVTER